MELSTKMFHINNGIQEQFIFKLAIVKNLDMFNVLLELYKLNIQDEPTLNIVIEHCTNNPHRGDLLKKVDSKLVDSINLNYVEIENYLPILKNHLNMLVQKYEPNKLVNFPICNKFTVIFNANQVKRLYNDLRGFYQNYMVMDALFKLTVKDLKNKPVVENITGKKDQLKKDHVEAVKLPEVETNEQTEFDNVLNLCINHSLKSLLIHLSCNYFIYISSKNANMEITENNIFRINIPTIFPASFVFNNNYIKSLVMSLTVYPIKDIEMRINKILNGISSEKEVIPIILMCRMCLLYLYYLAYLYQSHSSYLLNNLVDLFNDVNIQKRLLYNHTKVYFKRNDIEFNIYEMTMDQMIELDKTFEINDLGEKYRHLIPVSEDSFIEKIINDLKDDPKQYKIEINNKRIINIKSLIDAKVAASKKDDNIKSNVLLDPDNLLDYDQIYSNLFNYDFNNPKLTLAHQYFDNFIQDQSGFILKYKQKELDFKSVPVNILNMFNILKELLYNQNSEILKTNNTYIYYKNIVESVNDPSVFPHYSYLFIIYQIILPFMFLNYNIIEFEDVF
jgi:hypothetical protein